MQQDIMADADSAVTMINRIESVRRQVLDTRDMLAERGGQDEIVAAAEALNETLVVHAPPTFTLIGGLYLLRRAWLQRPVEPGHIAAAAGFIVGGSLLPLLIAMARGLGGLTEEIISGLVGFGFTVAFLGWLAGKMEVGEPPRTVKNSDPDESIPGYLLAVGVLEFAILSFSLVTIVAIAVVDPVGFAVEATVLTGLMMLAAGGLAHLLFRALVADRLPRGDFLTEIKPHLLPLLAAVAVLLAL
jgi:hypothetical protein